MDTTLTHAIVNQEESRELIDEFGIELQEVIGEGSFGVVFKSLDHNDMQQCAVKVTSKNKEKYSQIETSILSQLDHSNIVKFKKFFEIHSNKYIVMEYIGCGNLQQLIEARRVARQPFTEEEISSIMSHLISAVRYTHVNNVIHRDIKPGFQKSKALRFWAVSVVLKWCAVYIIFLKMWNSWVYGTRDSPREAILKVDIWSCGIIFYMLLTLGKHPFKQRGETQDAYVKRLSTIDPSKVFNDSQTQTVFPSDLSRDLFQRMVQKEPSNRYTASQVMKHPFITRNMDSKIPLSFQENHQLFQNERKLAHTIKAIMLVKLIQQKMANQFGENSYKVVKMTKSEFEQIKQQRIMENEEQNSSKGSIFSDKESRQESNESDSEPLSYTKERITSAGLFSNLTDRVTNQHARIYPTKTGNTTATNAGDGPEEPEGDFSSSNSNIINKYNNNSKSYLKPYKTQGIPKYPKVKEYTVNSDTSLSMRISSSKTMTTLSKVKTSFPSGQPHFLKPQVLHASRLNSTLGQISMQQPSITSTDLSNAQSQHRLPDRHSKSINVINNTRNLNFHSTNSNFEIKPNQGGIIAVNSSSTTIQREKSAKPSNGLQQQTSQTSSLMVSSSSKQPAYQQPPSTPPIYSGLIYTSKNGIYSKSNTHLNNNNNINPLNYIPLHQSVMKLTDNSVRPRHPSHQSQLNASKGALGIRKQSGSTTPTQYNSQQKGNLRQQIMQGFSSNVNNPLTIDNHNNNNNIFNPSPPTFVMNAAFIPSFLQGKNTFTHALTTNRNEHVATAPATSNSMAIHSSPPTKPNIWSMNNFHSNNRKLTLKKPTNQQNLQNNPLNSIAGHQGIHSLTEGSKGSSDCSYINENRCVSNNNNGNNQSVCFQNQRIILGENAKEVLPALPSNNKNNLADKDIISPKNKCR